MAIRYAPLLIIAIPLIEIALFVVVGSEIGVLATIGLVIATTILGSVLLRIQGFGVATRLRETMEKGGAPGRDLVDGFMIMLAGVLLLLPGFFTDALGILLFIPAVRDVAWRMVRSRIVIVPAGAGMGTRRPYRDGKTIDLDADEYESEHERQPDPDRKRLDTDR